MLTKEPLPLSHHDVTARFNGQYDSLIASGQYHPFTYPFGTLGATVVIIYLLLDHRNRPWLRRSRFLAWGFITVFGLWNIKSFRARNPAAAFGVGLISAWSILWCAVMLVFRDAQVDFRRIERKERQLDSASDSSQQWESNGHANGHHSNGDLRKRNTGTSRAGTTQSPTQRTGTLTWQSYPTGPFIERLDWVADIFSNFRGMGWNWRISGLPSPPLWVQHQLSSNTDQPPPSDEDEKQTLVSHTGVHRYHTKSDALRANLKLVIRDVIILDILKTTISHDAYFWDGNTSATPNYLPTSLHSYPVVVRSSRLLISLCAIYIALQAIFALGPLFFVGIIGPKYLGVRGEAWMYPDSFGSFSNVLNKGLAGWWGGWWHQSFRYAFEAPSTLLVSKLGLNPRSAPGKFIQLTIAFVLSGLLHACGSYTQLGHTYPLSGPFLFFTSQILGISLQLALSSLLSSLLPKPPKWLKQTANFIYVHVWFYYTAPLLCDDFARGGIWLFEPLPLSPLRGLGFGGSGDGWWCWWGGIFWWHKGDRWWNTGLAL